MSDRPSDSDVPSPTEQEIDAVLEEFGGDARAAIRALLHDLDLLAADYEADVSFGFVRGMPPRLGLKRQG